SQPYAASQQNQLFSARKAAEQRRNPRQNVSTATKSSGDGNPTLTQFLKNSMDWHKTSDPNRKAQLHAQNDALRRKLGYEYNPQTGASFDKYGHEMTAGVRMAYGSTPTERLNQATKLLHTSGVMGKTDKATVYPTAMQAAQGLDEDYFSGQTGYNAHKTMYDLFNRSDETWSSEDTQSRDRARQELSNEMSRIMKRYGLTYQPRDNADDIMNRLKAAGADEQTLAYVQENIDLRHAADRLGNSMEAVGKRWIASLPSLVDTSRQVSANVEESRQNEEYRQLEEQEQTLELTLQGMNSTAADGSVPADYQAMYDQLQEVRKRKNELTVNKGVDPNKWSQRMLREANEAQANAAAGLAPAPRWLTEQGISLAGNAPVMAASAIPVVGPAVGSIMMGGQAAGQRSFELNERGIGARESLTRGLTSGAIEAASERLPLGQMSKILHSGGVNAVKNILIQMGEEATEESASYFLNYVADLAANDPDAKFSLAELTQSAAGGAFGGLVFGTAGAVGSRAATDTERMNAADAYDYNQVQQLVQLDSELQAALKLPEGPIRERAVQTAQNKMADKISGLMTQQVAQNAELAASQGLIHEAMQENESFSQYLSDSDLTEYLNTGLKRSTRDKKSRMLENGDYPILRSKDEVRQFVQEIIDGKENTIKAFGKVNDRLANAISEASQGKIDIAGRYLELDANNLKHALKEHSTPKQKGDLALTVEDVVNLPEYIHNFDDILQVRPGKNATVFQLGKKINGHSIITEIVSNDRNSVTVKNVWVVSTNKYLNVYEKNRKSFSNQVAPETSAQMNLSAERFSANEGSKIPIAPNDVSGSTQGTASMIPQGETMSFMTGTKMGYPSDTVSPDGSDIPSVDNSIRQNVGNSNTSDTNIPLSEAMQYGRTPEQAVMEARAKAEGERVRQAREEQAAAEQQERLDRITNGKNRDIMQRVYEAQERAERVASRHALERATTRATASDADSYIDHTQEDIAIDLVNSLESERRFLTNLRNGWHLSDAELVNAERMAAGRGPVTEMDSHRYELVETYARAMRQYNEDMQPYYAFQRGLDDARLRRATELIKDSDNWKDSRGNLGLQIRTPERVLRKVMGDTAETEAIYQAYFAPVLKHDAEAIRWENTQRERLKGIMEGLSHEDSVYMHMKNRAELSPKNEAMQKQLADYVKENKSKIHFKQAESAMQKLYEMTSEIHPQVSEAGVRNGYAPLEFRQKYIPSLTPTKEGKWYNRILRKVGVETMVDELPTEIAGRTEDRRPGRQYAGFYNQREGINTEFDAFKAMDNYISGASNAIFHTDDIQNLRVLEDAIRSKYSDEGSRAELEAIRKDPDINIEDKEQKISKIWERNSGTLPSFPSWIAEYTNILAGKKSRTDRSAEQMFGRGLYRAMSDVEGKVAANMVGGNLSTAISNFIPLAQGSGEVRYSSMMRAMLDYGADLAKKNPAFHEDSDFLTNRRGSERVIKTKLQKASDAAGWTMNAIDNLSSEVMVRARYLDNVEKRHMSTEAALQEADRWAAGLIGDRARGAKPVIMESKSPLIKAFTMFQLEVMNQYDHLFGDIPHNLRGQGKSKAQIAAGTAAALLQVFVMSHLFNDAREKLTGSRGAFDPIEMVNDFVGRLTGYALPNIFDLLGEMMGDGIDEDDFRAEKSETAWDNVTATAQDIASNIPFVSGPLGSLAGAGNSRLPIQSVIPSIANIATAQGEDARSMAVIKELSKPLYGFLLPFGGLQAKKTVEGAATMFAGGSYSYDKKGEKILQFPTYGQKPADWAQALLFGKSSSDEARAWRESGYETLNAEETKVFDELRKRIKTWKENDNSEAVYAAIKAMRAITDEAREKYPDGYTDVAAGQKREMLFNDNDLNEMQKNYLDRELIGSAVGSSGDYSSRDMFDISQKVREARQDDAMEALKHGISVDEFANWDAIIEQTLTDNEVDAEDFVEGENNELYKKNEALYAILNEYANSGEHTDAEKNAFADYLLVSAMEESDRERWDAVKGTVSATDFVKFASDMTTYNKEYKGSGLSKSDAMQSILDGYKNLSDTQKDALFGVYSDSASGNAFHISKYEEAIKDNSFYSCLKDAGKKELRSLLNSYEKHVADNAKLDDWEAKAAVAKEAGISPGIYALFQVALQEADTDGKGLSQAKAKAAVESVGGLTQAQKAYLWQSANKTWKKNPYGSATVSEYKYSGGEFANPVEGGTISSKFGPRDTFSTSNGASSSRWHKSIDIAAPAGTAIKSVQGGKVTANGWVSGYGWTIEVTHDNGYVSMYHHMQNQSSVAVGTEVKQGQTIGNVGSTGNSTGPHLDLTITKDGTPVDPASLIGDYKNAKTGYVYEGSPVYTQLSSAASKSKKSSGGSRKSGGSSSGGLKQLKGLSGLKGLGF
ncbi:MAG: peptidoglycan DD-metalloendopeptidase family protein, partial [Agathobaculum butyriciproducens]|nr:peptidoglycan DD-metalloendopeptidase family protein [Agathobaculum butyriciproducens]